MDSFFRPDPVTAVLNQPPPLEDYDLYSTNAALREALAREGGADAESRLAEAGRVFGQANVLKLGDLANDHRPVLKTHDGRGRRRDEVEFHPAWHALLEIGVSRGLVSLPWNQPRPGAAVARAGLFMLFAEVEAGTQCPMSMSHGAVPVLSKFAADVPEIEETWLPKLLSGQYDPRFLPAAEKRGVLFGMGMTERQGGSDVRTNLTEAVAEADRGPGRRYRLTGHKWFFSAPMCDAFLVLAKAEGGVSCFLVPRFEPDGRLNAIRINRLKEKAGNWSNASSEVEFHGALGTLLGEEGRGVATIIEMASHTRIDCVLAAAGMMRRALAIVLHHTRDRVAFGRPLSAQPLMQNVLADLAVESEAATRLAMRLARTVDAGASHQDRLLGRLLTPAAKFHVCKRAPAFAFEAMEAMGGNGYVEESRLPRIYRELPVLSIWEGAGNVMCLDVLRGLARDPGAVEALGAELAAVRGDDPRLDIHAEGLMASLSAPAIAEADARRLAHRITTAVTAALLVRDAPFPVADAYLATRLAGNGWGASFGTLPPEQPVEPILARAWPERPDEATM